LAQGLVVPAGPPVVMAASPTVPSRSGTYAYNRSYVWDPLGNRIQQYDSGALTQNTFNAANALLVSTPPAGAPGGASGRSLGRQRPGRRRNTELRLYLMRTISVNTNIAISAFQERPVIHAR